jgi:hypothetical protein
MRARLVLAAMLSIAVGAATSVGVAQAAPLSQKPIRSLSSSSACPVMQIVAVRGSGETESDYGGYGRTVYDVVTQIGSAVANTASQEINYRAIPVGYGGWNHYPANYRASVLDGVTKLTSAIQGFIAGPCGSSTYLYLVGYSQGAQVVGDTFQGKLSATQRQRVGGLALIADPRFKGSQTGGVNVGDFSKYLNGVVPTPRTVTAGQVGKIRSYCAKNDPVCNFTRNERGRVQIVSLILRAHPLSR